MTTHIMPVSLRPVLLVPTMNLTRRGRFVFVGLPVITGSVALLVIAAIFLMPSTVKAGTAEVSEPTTYSVTVHNGDSLWEVAAQVGGERDRRDVIDDIVELNDLTSSQLTAGQVLEVPVN